MSLTYSAVFLLPAAEEPRLLARLGNAAAAPLGECVSLDFPLDDVLLAYLVQGIADQFGQSDTWYARQLHLAHPQYFPTEATGRVGCWYVDALRGYTPNRVYVRVRAAVSSMSRLLQQSPAIRQWFLALSREVHAEALLLDLEDEGLEFVARSGRTLRATVDDDGRVLQAPEVDRAFVVEVSEEYLLLND